jgi:hypothetical protein
MTKASTITHHTRLPLDRRNISQVASCKITTGRAEFNGMMNIRADVVRLEASFCTIETSSKDAVKIDDADKNSAVVCFTASNVLDTKRV